MSAGGRELPPLACNGCTACCRSGRVTLHPSLGDDLSQYEYEEVAEVVVLKRRDDGACVYLGEGGCSIYARRPAVCRAFDCRLHYLLTPWRRAKDDDDILAAARARM